MPYEDMMPKSSVRSFNRFRDSYIPFLSGRPERERVIGKDDVLNLLIAMNTAQSLDQFCILT